MAKANSPVTFNVQLIGGEVKTIAADENDVLYSAVSANGVSPIMNDHFVYYHRNTVVSPYYSIGHLNISDGDTLVLFEPKEKRKIPKPKGTLKYSRSIDNFKAFTAIDSDSARNSVTDDFYTLSPSQSNPTLKPVRPIPKYPTIIPRRPRTISRDPLPMMFKHDEAENNQFWENLSLKHSG